MMRQTWDHLFGKLAPDDDVRESEFFREKKVEESEIEKKKEQVTRPERVNFALAQITNELDRSRLAAGAKQAMAVYHELNRAHERGELDRAKAEASLHLLHDWLMEWAAVLEANSSGGE